MKNVAWERSVHRRRELVIATQTPPQLVISFEASFLQGEGICYRPCEGLSSEAEQ